MVNNVVSTSWWAPEIFVKLSVKFLFEINFHYDRYVASNIHKVLGWEQKTPETTVKSNILYLFIFCPLSDRVIKHFYCPGPQYPGFDQSIGVQNLTVWEGATCYKKGNLAIFSETGNIEFFPHFSERNLFVYKQIYWVNLNFYLEHLFLWLFLSSTETTLKSFWNKYSTNYSC